MKLAVLVLIIATVALRAAESDVLVLDGAETGFMHDALKRIGCPFVRSANLDASHRIAILCGKDVRADERIVAAFLQNGGHVLAVGGGAKWMIDAKIFDASGYYPTGTTEHFSTFEGYHRLTFGYPSATPADNWLVGVPSLLRATGGPLMRLGPRATSILSAGGPFSLAAFQRAGNGIALLIGPDPQGGSEYPSLEKATPKHGDQLDTDKLLANALAWLRDPGCNLVPNSGFEEPTESNPERSRWDMIVNNGGSSEWRHTGAPEGKVFLLLKGTKPNTTASASTHRPIVVEGGATYRLTCRHQSAATWWFDVRYYRSVADLDVKAAPLSIAIPASREWGRCQADLAIPDGVRLVRLTIRMQGVGEVGLDDIALRLTSRIPLSKPRP